MLDCNRHSLRTILNTCDGVYGRRDRLYAKPLAYYDAIALPPVGLLASRYKPPNVSIRFQKSLTY